MLPHFFFYISRSLDCLVYFPLVPFQVSGLKSITSKHLALASQIISFIHSLIPGKHFSLPSIFLLHCYLLYLYFLLILPEHRVLKADYPVTSSDCGLHYLILLYVLVDYFCFLICWWDEGLENWKPGSFKRYLQKYKLERFCLSLELLVFE